MSIGERIKELRSEKSLSQQKFAAQISISKSAIASYEREIQTPSANVIMSICDEFKVEPRWLLSGVGPKYDDKAITTKTDWIKHNDFMCMIEAKIANLAAEIDHLKQELAIANMERERADIEQYNALKASMKLKSSFID